MRTVRTRTRKAVVTTVTMMMTRRVEVAVAAAAAVAVAAAAAAAAAAVAMAAERAEEGRTRALAGAAGNTRMMIQMTQADGAEQGLQDSHMLRRAGEERGELADGVR